MKRTTDTTSSATTPAAESGVFPFSAGKGGERSLAQAGTKGQALLRLAASGAPVPPGFIVSTDHCRQFLAGGKGLPKATRADVTEGLARLAEATGLTFGDAKNPLVVTLGSSPPGAMPASLGAVTNLGLTADNVPALAKRLGDPRAAWDAFARLIQSYGLHVLGVSAEDMDLVQSEALEKARADSEADLDAAALEKLARDYIALCERITGAPLPAKPQEMLDRALEATFRAWNHPNAEEHREENALQALPGTAAIVQVTVFGTLGDNSGSGHCYTRIPGTGEKRLYGKYMPTAQGGDLTAGQRMADGLETLKKRQPEVYAKVEQWAATLESTLRDAQEIEFTVSAGELFILRSRSASRTAKASLHIATDLVDEGICSQQQALLLVNPLVVDEYLHPVLDKSHAKSVLTKGLGASPGSAVGQVVFFAEHAVELAAQGVKTILVRHETSPEDIDGLKLSEGIVTAHGGLTSHAAVVGRGMGKSCVVGAGDIKINYLLNEMTVGETTVKRLDWVSLDGATGEVFLGQLPQVQPAIEGRMARVLEWADAARTLGVHANADTPEDARRAVELGAEGIGLCRTEHMFFDITRIPVFRKMILAVDENGRSAALSDLLPLQRKDFMEIFRVMQGRPVTIRLLDPPLNEFLPKGIRSQTRMAKAMRISVELIQQRTEALSENNPMMGHRGCRLAVTYPEIYNMQVRAIVEAACIVKKEGTKVHPEIMVPLITTARELNQLRKDIVELIERVTTELGETIEIKVGTMIETPRAAVCSASIARYADFYSFGTNDLTQMGFGFSRDDAGMFLPTYLEKGILEEDPFMALDQTGIGGMVKMAVEAGRKANPNLKFGICGEHGGEPRSVKFFHRTGLDYVSCSPFRIPVARLAAGQAALEQKEANV